MSDGPLDFRLVMLMDSGPIPRDIDTRWMWPVRLRQKHICRYCCWGWFLWNGERYVFDHRTGWWELDPELCFCREHDARGWRVRHGTKFMLAASARDNWFACKVLVADYCYGRLVHCASNGHNENVSLEMAQVVTLRALGHMLTKWERQVHKRCSLALIYLRKYLRHGDMQRVRCCSYCLCKDLVECTEIVCTAPRVRRVIKLVVVSFIRKHMDEWDKAHADEIVYLTVGKCAAMYGPERNAGAAHDPDRIPPPQGTDPMGWIWGVDLSAHPRRYGWIHPGIFFEHLWFVPSDADGSTGRHSLKAIEDDKYV